VDRRQFLATLGAAALPAVGSANALPSERQLRWHELETTAFLHFTVNTFTDKEWGYGDEDPAIFNPAKFDADAIVTTLDRAGMRGVILTCKHHDGFCLWPTATTDHSVRASKWRDGKGDVVREIADAARRRGLGVGVYLSPWDRNNAAYGRPEYVEIYRRQLTELLTRYGPIFEVWHDGANGGDGYYGGAREKRTIDRNTYYDWPGTWALVRKLQPDAVIFSDIGPDIRWVGNEKGIAGDPCWMAYDPVGADGGMAGVGNVREKDSPTGTRHGSHWLPPECDVSIRPGWFWHERENPRVKTTRDLVNLYFQSVGRGANLLLNVPPNRDGLLSTWDTTPLEAFGRWRRATFEVNHAAGVPLKRQGDDFTLDLKRPAAFNVIRVREDIRQGQRIDAFTIYAEVDGNWETIAEATSIGPRRLFRLGRNVTAGRVRLRIAQQSAKAEITELALFAEQP